MASEPRQFAGHQFAGTPPADDLCQWCGTTLEAAKAAHSAGGIENSICPHFGPQDPDARRAFLQQQADRNRRANIAHGGQP